MNPLIWHKVAAVSGVAALGLGTYGAHAFKPQNPSYKDVWHTASLYHLVHTAALVSAPITKNPNLFGGLLTAGILAFSGTASVGMLPVGSLFGLMESDGAERNEMEWNDIPLFESFKIRWSGAEWSDMNFIPFHHLPSYFFPSNLGRMNNLSYSVLKFPNNGIGHSFRSAPFRSTPFRSVHFMIW